MRHFLINNRIQMALFMESGNLVFSLHTLVNEVACGGMMLPPHGLDGWRPVYMAGIINLAQFLHHFISSLSHLEFEINWEGNAG